MNSSELLTAPAATPEVTNVRDALQQLAARGKERGANLHSTSNETWQSRRAAVMEKLRAVRDRALFARQELFNMVGTVRVLHEQPELRAQVSEQVRAAVGAEYERVRIATVEAADRAVEKGLAAIGRAETRVAELRVSASDAGLRGKANIYTTLARTSEMVGRAQEKQATRAHSWADRIHAVGDRLDTSVEAGKQIFRTGWQMLGEALVRTHASRNPLRTPARSLERIGNSRQEQVVVWAERAGSLSRAADEIRARQRGSQGTRSETTTASTSSVVDVPSASTEPEVTWSTRENFPKPVEPPVANAVSFTPGSAGATPERPSSGTTISQDTATRGTAIAEAANKRFEPMYNNSTTK